MRVFTGPRLHWCAVNIGGQCLVALPCSSLVYPHCLPLNEWQLCRKQEILLYIVPLALFDVVYPRRQIPDLPPSSARLASEVFLSLFFYDLFFTIGHYISHKVRAIFTCRVFGCTPGLRSSCMLLFGIVYG